MFFMSISPSCPAGRLRTSLTVGPSPAGKARAKTIRVLRLDAGALALDEAKWAGSETEGYNVSFSESKLLKLIFLALVSAPAQALVASLINMPHAPSALRDDGTLFG
jgi:hypothetical protein